MSKLLVVSPSPHIHSGNAIDKLMFDVLIALIPAFLVSLWMFGIGALYVTLVSVGLCVLTEWSITKYLLKQPSTVTNGSAVVTGVLLAFNVPANIPFWILALGAIMAIGVGKMTFGGLGNNPFNPALVGRVFMLISFPVQMTSWPLPIVSRWDVGNIFNFGACSPEYIDTYTGATPLGILKESVKAAADASGESLSDILSRGPSVSDMLLGNMGGSMGEAASGALLLGFAFLLIRKVITWHIPVSIILTTAIFTGILWWVNPDRYANPLYHILTGGLLLGAIFMATDYATSPMTTRGMFVFGAGTGIITVVIRVFGAYPEGVSFAILIMNAFVPLINTCIKPERFGGKLKQ